MTAILIRRWPFEDRKIQGEHCMKMEDWNNASIRQGTTKIASKSLENRKRQGRISVQVSEGIWPC